MDIGEGINYAIGAIKTNRLYRDYLVYGGLLVIYAILYVGFILFAAGIESIENTGNLLAMGLGIVFGVFALILARMLVATYFQAKFINSALAYEGVSKTDFGFGTFVKIVATEIVQFLHILFFWRDKRWLALYVLPILALVAIYFVFSGMLSGGVKGEEGVVKLVTGTFLAMGIILIACTPLMVGWIYHGIRLCFMQAYMLIDPSMGYGKCSQMAWQLTDKKVLSIFVYNFVFAILVFVALIPVFVVQFGANLVLIFLTLGNELVQDVGTSLVSDLLAAIYLPILTGAGAFFYVYIFKEIKREKEGLGYAAWKEPQHQGDKAQPAGQTSLDVEMQLGMQSAKALDIRGGKVKPAAKKRKA